MSRALPIRSTDTAGANRTVNNMAHTETGTATISYTFTAASRRHCRQLAATLQQHGFHRHEIWNPIPANRTDIADPWTLHTHGPAGHNPAHIAQLAQHHQCTWSTDGLAGRWQ